MRLAMASLVTLSRKSHQHSSIYTSTSVLTLPMFYLQHFQLCYYNHYSDNMTYTKPAPPHTQQVVSVQGHEVVWPVNTLCTPHPP